MSLEFGQLIGMGSVGAEMAVAGEQLRSSPAAAASRRRRRQVAYAIYLALMGIVIAAGLTTLDPEERADFFVERGVVEVMQWIHLAIASVLFGFASFVRLRRRELEGWFLAIFACGTCWALNRESDFFWRYHDQLLVYKLLKIGIALPGLLILFWYFPRLWAAWRSRPLQPLFLLLYVAIGGYAFAQLVSTAEDVVGIARYIRRTSEESLELLAGAFFVFAAIEGCVWKRLQGLA